MKSRSALNLLVGVVALSAGCLSAPTPAVEHESYSLEQLAVEMARTPADHLAIAEHFRTKAAQARAEARYHKLMSRLGTGGKTMGGRPRRTHCRKIAAQQEAMALEYEALAALHEEEAGNSK